MNASTRRSVPLIGLTVPKRSESDRLDVSFACGSFCILVSVPGVEHGSAASRQRRSE